MGYPWLSGALWLWVRPTGGGAGSWGRPPTAGHAWLSNSWWSFSGVFFIFSIDGLATLMVWLTCFLFLQYQEMVGWLIFCIGLKPPTSYDSWLMTLIIEAQKVDILRNAPICQLGCWSIMGHCGIIATDALQGHNKIGHSFKTSWIKPWSIMTYWGECREDRGGQRVGFFLLIVGSELNSIAYHTYIGPALAKKWVGEHPSKCVHRGHRALTCDHLFLIILAHVRSRHHGSVIHDGIPSKHRQWVHAWRSIHTAVGRW